MASTGHSATHRVQSMHSSGSMARKLGPSWKQSTGQTSTQSVYLQRMQFSVTTKVMVVPPVVSVCHERVGNMATCCELFTANQPTQPVESLQRLAGREIVWGNLPQSNERGIGRQFMQQLQLWIN